VAPHGLVIFRFTCEDQSQAQRLIQLSHPIMSKRWKCSNEKTVGFENGYTGRHRRKKGNCIYVHYPMTTAHQQTNFS